MYFTTPSLHIIGITSITIDLPKEKFKMNTCCKDSSSRNILCHFGVKATQPLGEREKGISLPCWLLTRLPLAIPNVNNSQFFPFRFNEGSSFSSLYGTRLLEEGIHEIHELLGKCTETVKLSDFGKRDA